MRTIQERLDCLRMSIQEQDFLTGKGLSNEVNIRIFCYDPADEIIVQHFMEQLTSDQSLRCRPIERNLYRIFLSICDDLDILDAVEEMEEEDGGNYLLNELHSSAGTDEFIEKINDTPHQEGDVLILTGIGDVFPFMRVHTLLEAIQKYYADIPILVMYPGKFDGHQLRLFGRLRPSDYYRAFSMVQEQEREA